MADERDTENPDEMYHPHVHEEGTLLKWDDDSDHDVNETGHYELMAEAIRELLIEKGVVTADEIRENLEFMDSRGTHLGAKVVAKAWTDPAFKNRLMEDGSAAVGGRRRTGGGREHRRCAQSGGLHALLVLPAHHPRAAAGLVQIEELSLAGGQ